MPRTKWAAVEAGFREQNPEHDAAVAAELERLEAELAVTRKTLTQVRKARQLTQAEVAERLALPQPQISVLERRADLYLSTLDKYIRALGGRLELVAVFDGERVPLEVGDLAGEAPETAPGEAAPFEYKLAAG